MKTKLSNLKKEQSTQTKMVLVALVAFAVACSFAAPLFAQGPLVLMNIDAEDGNGSGSAHGGKGPYTSVMNDILSNVTNGGSGILVIGAGKSSTDHVTVFWNAIGTNVGQSVTTVNGATNIANQSFANFAIIAVASNYPETGSGGLTQAENNALAGRSTDIATHVNGGGGLFGLTQNYMSNKYAYLTGALAVTVASESYNDITATPAGQAVGITDTNLDVCCWHDTYTTFPSFLNVLAVRVNTNRAAAIGGAQVIITQGISLIPTSASNDVGTQHTVTATVMDSTGTAMVGTTVIFIVTSGPNAGANGFLATDNNGQASFSYTGSGGVGTDTIQACFTDSQGQQQCTTATKDWTPPPEIEVAVDIKPQSCPNPLNVNSKGLLPVAICGTGDFDVIDIELVSLSLVGVAPLRVDFEDVATPFAPFLGKENCDECTEEGRDGLLDLTLKFDMQEIVAAIEADIGHVDDGDCLVLTLEGQLLDGTPIVGEDVVIIRKKGKK